MRLACSEVRKSEGWVMTGSENSNEADEFTLTRKAAKVDIEEPVPQTDTGRRQENCKTNGITIG